MSDKYRVGTIGDINRGERKEISYVDDSGVEEKQIGPLTIEDTFYVGVSGREL